MAKPRPKHLNLFQISQPIPAIVSILHRLSGALLFLFIWLFLWGIQRSLESPEGFNNVRSAIEQPAVKIVVIVLAWAYFHHFFAGLRHIALDVHIGNALPQARAMAWAALFISLALTAMVGVLLW